MPGSRLVAHQFTMTNTKGDPQTAQLLKLAQIQELVHQDWCRAIHDIAHEVGIGYGTCQRVLTKELGVLWREQTWLLHHDNALSRTSILTQQFLAKYKMAVIPPPPTVLLWFGTLWLLPISKNEIEAESMPVWYHWGDPDWIAESTWQWQGPGSSVGIATGYGMDGPGIESLWGRDFSHTSRPALGPTQPPVQWVLGLSQG
jgi:hypothetical protein